MQNQEKLSETNLEPSIITKINYAFSTFNHKICSKYTVVIIIHQYVKIIIVTFECVCSV